MRRALLLAPLLAAGLLSAAPAAEATLTCSEPTTLPELVVISDDVDSTPIIGHDAAGKITVESFDPDELNPTCAPAALTSTLTNIATVVLRGPTVGAPLDGPVVDQSAGLFAPGSTNLPPNDEIKFEVSDWRRIAVRTPAMGGGLTAGTAGVDMNADGDVDLTFAAGTAPEYLELAGGPGRDTLMAAGGNATGGPVRHPVRLFGLGDDDTLVGGEGDDQLVGRMGDDVTDGRGGVDVANYNDSGGNIVDLALTGPQDTGEAGTDTLRNLEDLRGGAGTDRFFGDGGSNDIDAEGGIDVVDPRGGADTVEGGPGADVLRLRDGGRDTADCGDDADTSVDDLPGTDALTACEAMDLAPGASVTGGPGLTNDRTPTFGLAVGEPGAALQCRFDAALLFTPCGLSFTAPAALADGAHTLVVRGVDAQGPSLQPADRRFVVDATAPRITGLRASRRGPRSARLSFTLSEGGQVAINAERLAKGRKVRGHCRAATRHRRKRPRCTRVRPAGHLRLFAESAGASTKTFRGRTIRRGTLRRLAAGRYRLTLRTTDVAGNVSKPGRIRIRVRARRRSTS